MTPLVLVLLQYYDVLRSLVHFATRVHVHNKQFIISKRLHIVSFGSCNYLAYSMGQIIKSVCVCQCVSLSVCLCVCPSASTLTVAFLDRFSPKLAQTYELPIKKASSLGVNIAPPVFLFPLKNSHFRPRGPENPCKY